MVNDDVTVPVDDNALNLLETALSYHFGVEKDENGDPIGVGEFSLYQLLDFWSGFDPRLLQKDEESSGEIYRGGPLLTTSDVIRALIAEIRRLRNDS